MQDNDIKKALEEWIKNYDGLCKNFITLGNALNYINRLEAEKKELQELVDTMGDYFPACIDCEGKTPLGEQTDKCVYEIDNTNYCTKRGIATIFAIRDENRELKAENEKLKNSLAISEKGIRRYVTSYKTAKAEAYKEFAERLKENSIATFSFKGVVMVEEIDDLLKELVGEDNAKEKE